MVWVKKFWKGERMTPTTESRKRVPFPCLSFNVIKARENSRMVETKIIFFLFLNPFLGTVREQLFSAV